MSPYNNPTTPVEDCDCPQSEHRHGTRISYVVHRCRCDDCREANLAYQRHRPGLREGRMVMPWAPPDFKHAACRGLNDVMFDDLHPARAIEICSTCVHEDDCAVWAIEHRIPHGIWGGTKPSQRRRAAPTRQKKEDASVTDPELDEMARQLVGRLDPIGHMEETLVRASRRTA